MFRYPIANIVQEKYKAIFVAEGLVKDQAFLGKMISQWQFLFPNNVDAVLMKITEKFKVWKTSFFRLMKTTNSTKHEKLS